MIEAGKRLIRWIADKHRIFHNLVDQFWHSRSFHDLIMIYANLLINLCFAVFKLAMGLRIHSVWLCTLAVYYGILATTRFQLVQVYGQMRRDVRVEFHREADAGLLMLFVTLLFIAMESFFSQAYYATIYPGVLIYVAAGYAFYAIVSSVYGVYRYRRTNSPILSAEKLLNMGTAVLTLYFLQTAVNARFEKQEGLGLEYLRRMSRYSKTILYVCLMGIAFYLLIRGYVGYRYTKPEERVRRAADREEKEKKEKREQRGTQG